MRALTLILLLSPALTACVDDPCRGAGEARLYVYGPDNGHRLDASDPTAFASIGEALAASEPGGTVCVSGGTWAEVLRLDKPGVQLLGAGPEETVLRGASWAPGEPVLSLEAEGLLVRGLSVEGGAVGVAVQPDGGARLEDLAIRDNELGLLALDPSALALEGVDISRNRLAGAELHAGRNDPVVSLRGGRISGNGELGRSAVGGLYSELDLLLDGVTVRDNAGQEVGDLDVAGHLEAWGLELERAERSPPEAPRIRAGDGLELVDSRVATEGSPGLYVTCRSQPLHLENVVITAAGALRDQLRLSDCEGVIYHSTLVNLDGGRRGAALALLGGGELTVANTALVGFDRGVDDGQYAGTWRRRALFEGGITEAQLVSPIGPEPDVRPQSDSPLLDSGSDLGVATDIQGAVRPRGGGPDVGAYEY